MLFWPDQPLEEECEIAEAEVRLLHTRCKNEQMDLSGVVQNSLCTCSNLHTAAIIIVTCRVHSRCTYDKKFHTRKDPQKWRPSVVPGR